LRAGTDCSLDPGLSVAELTKVMSYADGAGEHDLGIRRHQSHEHALVASGSLSAASLAQAVDARAVEAGA
jgi:hypothetical protein